MSTEVQLSEQPMASTDYRPARDQSWRIHGTRRFFSSSSRGHFCPVPVNSAKQSIFFHLL